MNQEYDNYKQSVEEVISRVNELNSINVNILNNLDIYSEKESIDYLNKNSILLTDVLEILKNINSNLSLSNIGVRDSLEEATSKLNITISAELDNIDKVADNTREYFETSKRVEKDILDEQFDAVLDICEKILNMLQGINLSEEDTSQSMISVIIKDKIFEEKSQIELIQEETNNLISINHSESFNQAVLNNYCELLKIELEKTNNMIIRLKNISENNKSILTNSEVIALNLFSDILETQQEGLSLITSQINSFSTSNVEIEEDEVETEEENEDEISDEVESIFDVLKEGDVADDEVIKKLENIYNSQKAELDEAREALEEKLYNIEIDTKEKDADTLKYKNYSSMLNKSFWEARYNASLDNIKYPSALYEQTVKEYQNDYLIEHYNISLVAVEDFIEEYKKKYASDIYMDEIYEQALVLLKDESTASVKELCDESTGLSMLDKKAYDLLEDDLNEVIKEIGLVKKEENFDDSLDISEYKKSIRLNKLIERKNIIEKNIYNLSKRAEKLEQNDI